VCARGRLPVSGGEDKTRGGGLGSITTRVEIEYEVLERALEELEGREMALSVEEGGRMSCRGVVG
jgi:hypothetical protein